MKQNNDLYLITTDTIIGIAGQMNDVVKEKIYNIKQRPKHKKLIIFVNSIEMAKTITGEITNFENYANKYWPGPYTLVVNDDVALRIPDCRDLLELMSDTGPLYVTSANISDKSVAKNMKEAIQMFPTITNFLDSCVCLGQPSTIIDIRNGKVLR